MKLWELKTESTVGNIPSKNRLIPIVADNLIDAAKASVGVLYDYEFAKSLTFSKDNVSIADNTDPDIIETRVRDIEMNQGEAKQLVFITSNSLQSSNPSVIVIDGPTILALQEGKCTVVELDSQGKFCGNVYNITVKGV